MTQAIKPVIGTASADYMQGTNAHEVLSGRGGDDVIYAANGHDEVWGGTGDDLLYGDKGNDIVYGGGGPSYINLSALTISGNYEGRVVFEGETAGYRNSLGSYKVDANGTIYDVTMHFPNASLQGSGGDLIAGQSESALSLSAGDQIGFFIVSNGYSYNGGYSNIDFSNGSLEFRNSDGSTASLNSTNPSLWFVGADGTSSAGQSSELLYHKYHTAAGVDGEDYSLNADGIAHTVGLLNTDRGEITLGFEDLFNGGDRDFDDSIFTIDIGNANARVLDPNVALGGGNGDNDGIDEGNGSAVTVSNFSDNDVLYGGTGHDQLYGRAGNDLHYGGSGQDEVYGGSGIDTAYGGTGNDLLKGGPGNDWLYGESGVDALYGGIDNDYLDGGTGNDDLYGNSGDDILLGDSGHDKLYGGTGEDSLDGGVGNDHLFGSSGNDVLEGGSGNDQLEGGNGNDYVAGGSGNDQLKGNSGNDFFVSGAGRDHIDGGSGSDTIDYSSVDESVRVDIHGKRTTGGDSDTLYSVENVIGTDFNDWFRGDKRDNEINGGAGDDYIRGLGGNDELTGGEGSDTFFWRASDVGNNLDRILDFSLDTDIIEFNVSSSLTLESMESWLSLTESSGHTYMSIDLDGQGNNYSDTQFLELQNITEASLTDFSFVV